MKRTILLLVACGSVFGCSERDSGPNYLSVAEVCAVSAAYCGFERGEFDNGEFVPGEEPTHDTVSLREDFFACWRESKDAEGHDVKADFAGGVDQTLLSSIFVAYAEDGIPCSGVEEVIDPDGDRWWEAD